jgi:hypothetical protein
MMGDGQAVGQFFKAGNETVGETVRTAVPFDQKLP